MQSRYSAIDLKGIKNQYFDEVASLHKDMGDYYCIELDQSNINNRKEIIKKENPHIIFCKGKDLKLNRKIVETKDIDILSRPYPIDDTIAKIASKNDKGFEICIKDIVITQGYLRAKLMQSLSRTIGLALKRDVKIIMTSGADDLLDIITPRELIAFGNLLGMSFRQSKGAISTVPRSFLERGLRS